MRQTDRWIWGLVKSREILAEAARYSLGLLAEEIVDCQMDSGFSC